MSEKYVGDGVGELVGDEYGDAVGEAVRRFFVTATTTPRGDWAALKGLDTSKLAALAAERAGAVAPNIRC